MKARTANLENSLLYRLIKVLYIIVLLLAVIFALVLGWEGKPQSIVDDEKSYIACYNGNTYKLDANGIYVYSMDATQLNIYDDVAARKLCQYGLKNDYSTYYNNLKTSANINYQLKLVEGTSGSWTAAFETWVIGILGSFVVLNLLRETLNYIFFGKSFDWMWLLIPLNALTSSKEEQL